MTRLALAVIIFLTAAFHAAARDGGTVAIELGELLGNAEGCSVAISEAAVRLYVEKNITPDDLEFQNMLVMVVDNIRHDFGKMSEVERQAICFQTERSARALGLLMGR